ncbi:MAG: glycosyltransferase family 2 protein [Nanoarchaeota archaeon]
MNKEEICKHKNFVLRDKILEDVWVIIPAYNEENYIKGVIEKAKKYTKHIVVVDDGSKDSTKSIAEDEGVITLSHIVNLGKGSALKTGCDYVIKKLAEKIIVLDADAQHNPNDIPMFFSALENADIVFGYRKIDKNMPFILRFGNYAINKIAKLLFNIDLRDTQCGYRAFTASAYNEIRWRASDYSMESEMVANTGKKKLKYAEVPIETVYLDKYKGTTIMTGVKIVLNMLSWRIR